MDSRIAGVYGSEGVAVTRWWLTRNRAPEEVSRSVEWYFYLAAGGIILASFLSLGVSHSTSNTHHMLIRSLRFPGTSWVGQWHALSQHYRPDALRLLTPELPSRIVPTSVAGPRIEYYVVNKGDTLSSIWREFSRLGEGGVVADQAVKVLEKEKNFKAPLQVGERVELTVVRDDISQLKRTLSDGRLLTVKGTSSLGYEGKILQPKILEQTRVVNGVIRTSFSDAARESSLPYDVVDTVVDLFSDRLDFGRDLSPNDTFVVKFLNRVSESGVTLDPGPILAVSLRINGVHYAAIRKVDAKGKDTYVNENGSVIGGYFLKYPLQFTRISSVFSDSRMHPVLKFRRPHYGVDYAAPIGTPVRSVGDGTILKAGYYGSAGKMIKIRHNNTYSTAYLHLGSIQSTLKVGSKITRGQVIGTVGMTGLTSGPHLHFSLYENDKYIDPLQAKLSTLRLDDSSKDKELVKTVLAEMMSFHKISKKLAYVNTKNVANAKNKRLA